MEKLNMNLEASGLPEWDRHDPINAGILSVELVSGHAGVLLRRIRYREPVTGTEYVFLTNELNLSPGIIAFLEDKLRLEGIENQAEIQRKEKTFAQAQALATAAGRAIPSCVAALQRLTQSSVKLLRWLRSSLDHRLDWHTSPKSWTQF
jgi:hypothetical protein